MEKKEKKVSPPSQKESGNKKEGSSKKTASRNGKGDSPRNISLVFKKNYDKINWEK